MHMVATCVAIDDAPVGGALSRAATGVGVPLPERGVPLEIGRGRIMREGTTIALLTFGGAAAECLKAAEELGAYGLSTTVADARFAKPLDTDLVNRLAREHEVVITIEEGSIGGFGSHVLHHLAMTGHARPRAEDPHDGAARRLPRPRFAEGAIRRGRAQRPPHRRDGAGGARPRDRRAAGARLSVSRPASQGPLSAAGGEGGSRLRREPKAA